MPHSPACPKCQADYTYRDGALMVCPACAHEWNPDAPTTAPAPAVAATEDPVEDTAVRDANGNVLATGDTVIVIKDLKVKGSSLVVKGGTKVKNIRLVDGDHDIDCRIEGIGAMQLKSEFVKKA
jgi:protein PhnA